MKCPKCELALSSSRDLCPRCGLDLRSHKRRLKIRPTRPAIFVEAQKKADLDQLSFRPTEVVDMSQLTAELEEMPEPPPVSAAETGPKPKQDLSDLLEALSEISTESRSGQMELTESAEANIPPIDPGLFEELDDDQIDETLSAAEQFTESARQNIEEAKEATAALSAESDFNQESSYHRGSVSPQVSPEVLEFGDDGDDLFDEKLDAMIGDVVFDVEAVQEKKIEVRKPPADGDSLFYDDVEISFEIEVDGEEIEMDGDEDEILADSDDDDLDEMPEDELLGGLVESLGAIEAGTREVDINTGAESSRAEAVSTVPASQRQVTSPPSSPKIPDSLRATLRAAKQKDDPSVKRLAALLAEAYGLDPELLFQEESIDALSDELDSELDALLDEGTTFYGEASAEPEPVQVEPTAPIESTIHRLQAELASELDSLQGEGTNFLASGSNNHEFSVEADAADQEAPEDLPDDELALLQAELEAEIEELQAAAVTEHPTAQSVIEQNLEDAPLDLSDVYSELEDTLHDLEQSDAENSDATRDFGAISDSIVQTSEFFVGDLNRVESVEESPEQYASGELDEEPDELATPFQSESGGSFAGAGEATLMDLSDALTTATLGEKLQAPEEKASSRFKRTLIVELPEDLVEEALSKSDAILKSVESSDLESSEKLEEPEAARLDEAVQTGNFIAVDLESIEQDESDSIGEELDALDAGEENLPEDSAEEDATEQLAQDDAEETKSESEILPEAMQLDEAVQTGNFIAVDLDAIEQETSDSDQEEFSALAVIEEDLRPDAANEGAESLLAEDHAEVLPAAQLDEAVQTGNYIAVDLDSIEQDAPDSTDEEPAALDTGEQNKEEVEQPQGAEAVQWDNSIQTGTFIAVDLDGIEEQQEVAVEPEAQHQPSEDIRLDESVQTGNFIAVDLEAIETHAAAEEEQDIDPNPESSFETVKAGLESSDTQLPGESLDKATAVIEVELQDYLEEQQPGSEDAEDVDLEEGDENAKETRIFEIDLSANEKDDDDLQAEQSAEIAAAESEWPDAVEDESRAEIAVDMAEADSTEAVSGLPRRAEQ